MERTRFRSWISIFLLPLQLGSSFSFTQVVGVAGISQKLILSFFLKLIEGMQLRR
jgi:hypothetical protein